MKVYGFLDRDDIVKPGDEYREVYWPYETMFGDAQEQISWRPVETVLPFWVGKKVSQYQRFGGDYKYKSTFEIRRKLNTSPNET